MNVYVFLAEGFEEIEAVATVDLLRRAGLSTITVAVGESLEVVGAHHLPVRADLPIGQIDPDSACALVLPGGLPGVTNLAACEPLRQIIRKGYDDGKIVAAICAAPSILGELGILDGRKATCYPSFEPQLGAYIPTEDEVAVSNNVITAKAAGVTLDFALAIISALKGRATAESVARQIFH